MLREGFDVVQIGQRSDAVLRNLLEFYLHDLAEWFRFDQLSDGRYTQSTDRYWQGGHEVYLLYAGEIPVGFGLVGPAQEWLPGADATDMDEFFVVRRHRRHGIGTEFAADLWRRRPGPWLVRVFQPNDPALQFWRRAISEFSQGDYKEEPRKIDGNVWSHFIFEARAPLLRAKPSPKVS
jgi:predicted acetyltransferase